MSRLITRFLSKYFVILRDKYHVEARLKFPRIDRANGGIEPVFPTIRCDGEIRNDNPAPSTRWATLTSFRLPGGLDNISARF